MQLEIFKPSQSSPAEWNNDDLIVEVAAMAERYKSVVYTPETRKDAQKDRAMCNKFLEAIDGFLREERKKALESFEVTKEKAEKIKALVIPARDRADAFDKKCKQIERDEKRAKIEADIYAPMIGNLSELIPYDRLHEARWLNVTCSMGTVGEEMARKIDNITSGLAAIDKLDLDEALTEQARSIFLKKFDLAAAINATERILAQRAAMERLRASQETTEASENTSREFNQPETKKAAEVQQGGDNPEEKIYVVDFRVRVNAEKLKKLGDFMRANGIKPERI